MKEELTVVIKYFTCEQCDEMIELCTCDDDEK